MKITPEVKAFAIEQAGRRCECTGENCAHHRRGARCKRGLRGDEWKVFWRTEGGGATRKNIQAWCLECFDNNFEAPRETVALLALDIAGYNRLMDEDEWRAITLKSVLRDAARRVASEHGGGLVLARANDDVLLEFESSLAAIEAARSVPPAFRDVAGRLNIPIPEICGALHCGEVTRWRSGLLVGEAVETARSLRTLAAVGQLVLTGSAAEPLAGSVELELIESPKEQPGDEMWALKL